SAPGGPGPGVHLGGASRLDRFAEGWTASPVDPRVGGVGDDRGEATGAVAVAELVPAAPASGISTAEQYSWYSASLFSRNGRIPGGTCSGRSSSARPCASAASVHRPSAASTAAKTVRTVGSYGASLAALFAGPAASRTFPRWRSMKA